MTNLINNLVSIEKAIVKLENIVLVYTKKSYNSNAPHERAFYAKAQKMILAAETNHSNILSALWKKGIFA